MPNSCSDFCVKQNLIFFFSGDYLQKLNAFKYCTYIMFIINPFPCRSDSVTDALYELPEHIKAITSKAKKTEDMLSNQMLSGIPEMDLGIE